MAATSNQQPRSNLPLDGSPTPKPIPSSQKRQCEACNGLGVLFKGVPWYGGFATIYPRGTEAKSVMIPCPLCGDEQHKARIAKHSNLEPNEREMMLTDWKLPTFMGHPGWVAQRKKAKREIGNALRDKRGLYTFWGDFGSGKTMSAWIILNEMRQLYGIEGFFAPFAGVLDQLRQMWSHKEDTSDYWDKLLNIPVLAVDEVTRFNESKEWEREKLFVLVDTRYRRRGTHLTVLTTNENPYKSVSPDDNLGYLFSRMREGVMIELRGDVRAMARGANHDKAARGTNRSNLRG